MTGGSPAFGPRLEPGSTQFRLWAPGVERGLSLAVDDRPLQPMTRGAAGWWTADAAARPGADYMFVLPDGTRVPDPASRFQPNDVSGPSQLVDEDSYVWRNTAWRGRAWTEAVIYELHVGVLGGYAAAAADLPRLAELGVTAIELMPLADFGGARNWGYDGVLPFAPASTYGGRDELKAFIDAAHGLGLMVLLDAVYNHFGPEGNYLPIYAPEFFDARTPTPWGAAIRFSEPVVRSFFMENALYWLGVFRFDGLRLDAVHHIVDESFVTDLAEAARATFPDRHMHIVLENERNEAAPLRNGVTAQWNDDFHNVMHVLLTGETSSYYAGFADAPEQKLLRSLAEGFVYQGEPSPHHDGERRGTPSADLPATRFVNFLQNHDQVGNRAFGERLIALTSAARLKAATALLLLAPQIPLLFMGEEFGARSPFLFFTDFAGGLADAVRQGRGREFARDPAFQSDANDVPDPNDLATFASSRPVAPADAEDWSAFYARLLRLRHRHIAPRLTGVTALGGGVLGPAAVFAQWRLADDAVLSIAMNLGDDAATFEAPAGELLWGQLDRAGEIPTATTRIWLKA